MAQANTASLVTNLNVDPYYDDFDESKNFHRVLYRPGFAVQARELTQMQTILQNQIDRFGENIFKEGSVVAGLEVNYDNTYNFVKIRDADQTGNTINVDSFIGSRLTGVTSNISAIVVGALDGAEADAPDYKTFYVKYIDSGSGATAGNTYFSVSEKLNANTGGSANVISNSPATGLGSYISFGEGVVFAKDHFIRVPAQNMILGRYTSNVNYKIGFNLTETIETSSGDTSLLDPAQGSFNYTAPGADRLKIVPTLVKYELNANTGADFVEIYRTKQGQVQINNEKPRYADIRDYLAKRTYEINGDFIVRGLNVRLREHLAQANNGGVFPLADNGDINRLVVDVEPGIAYVSGYDINSLITAHVPVDKSLDFESVEAATASANYGNFTRVKEVAGAWRLNDHTRVDLYDTYTRAVSNGTYSTSTPIGTKIGSARVRAVEYDEGTKGSSEAIFNMYLYDIKMTQNTFSEVRSVYIDNTSVSQANGFADIIVNSSNNAPLNETQFNRSIFKLPASAIKRLRDTNGNIDTNFRFIKSFMSLLLLMVHFLLLPVQ